MLEICICAPGTGKRCTTTCRIGTPTYANHFPSGENCGSAPISTTFAVVCEPEEIPARVLDRYGDLVDRISFYAPYKSDPEVISNGAREFKLINGGAGILVPAAEPARLKIINASTKCGR